MADEAANPAATATGTERATHAADEQPGTALEPADAAPPAVAEPQLPMLPGEVRPHPSPSST